MALPVPNFEEALPFRREVAGHEVEIIGRREIAGVQRYDWRVWIEAGSFAHSTEILPPRPLRTEPRKVPALAEQQGAEE